jgi:hypothetical protein
MTSLGVGELETIVSTPNDLKPQAFPSNLVYWVKPGKYIWGEKHSTLDTQG